MHADGDRIFTEGRRSEQWGLPESSSVRSPQIDRGNTSAPNARKDNRSPLGYLVPIATLLAVGFAFSFLLQVLLVSAAVERPLLFYVWFYYWSAAVAALSIGFVLDRSARRTYATILVTGLAAGAPAIIEGLITKPLLGYAAFLSLGLSDQEWEAREALNAHLEGLSEQDFHKQAIHLASGYGWARAPTHKRVLRWKRE